MAGFNDQILDVTSDPALLFAELGPFAIPFDDCLLDPPVPANREEIPVIDVLPALSSTIASDVDMGYDIGPKALVTNDENDISVAAQFESDEFDDANFGDSLPGIASPRTLAFLVEINEILSNGLSTAENAIQTETNTVTALDDTTLERRRVEHFALRTGDAGGRSSLQEAREGDKVKEMKALQVVFPVNPKSKAPSGDRFGDLKTRRYTPFQSTFSWK
jgi:hypothetical protein